LAQGARRRAEHARVLRRAGAGRGRQLAPRAPGPMASERKRGLSKIPSTMSSPRARSPRVDAPVGRAGMAPLAGVHEALDLAAGPASEQLSAAVRSAVRQELVAFFGAGEWQAVPTKAVPTKATSFCGTDEWRQGGPTKASMRTSDQETAAPVQFADLESEDGGALSTNMQAEHFARFTEADHHHDVQRKDSGVLETRLTTGSNSVGLNVLRDHHRTVWSNFVNCIEYIWTRKEPERTGVLAKIVKSRYFERIVQVVILCNCMEMGLSANYEISIAPSDEDTEPGSVDIHYILDVVFQIIYTVELCLKLALHRQFFFWNEDAGFNSFDFFLVISGYVDFWFSDGGGGSTALRTVRILKLGKALRALKVIAGFRTLRAILVCIQGSFVTLLWSVLMLCIVFYIFSLIFVQQAASQIEEIGDTSHPAAQSLLDNFASVQMAMLTLGKASFGGEDWGVGLDIISQCGFTAAFFYMLFVAFSQIALINIITGIFVDNAMQSLTPNKEQQAMNLDAEERGYAKELERLCIDVDADKSGCLTKEQFNDGIEKGRIPLLLHLLGLNRQNVQNFFDTLCDATPDSQVDIKSFVRGCMRLKGSATSFDLQAVMLDLKYIEKSMAHEFKRVNKRIVAVERNLLSESSQAAFAAKCPVDSKKGYFSMPSERLDQPYSTPRDDEPDPI